MQLFLILALYVTLSAAFQARLGRTVTKGPVMLFGGNKKAAPKKNTSPGAVSKLDVLLLLQ